MEYSLDNIRQIDIDNSSVNIQYLDGTTHFIEMNSERSIKFIKGFVSKVDSPIVDHCI